MGHNGQLGCKAFHVLFFLLEEGQGNQEGESRVLMSRGFEAPVQGALDVLPQGPSVGTHHHATAHRRIVREFRPQDQLVVPFREVLLSRGQFGIAHATPSAVRI